jgi:hypothetical protein
LTAALFLFVAGCAAPIAFDIQLEDRRVMDEPVDGGHRHAGVREDVIPAGEWLVGGYQKTFPLVSLGDQFEQRIDSGFLLPSQGRCLM